MTALLGVGIGFLPSGIEQANALQSHMQTGRVHHDKHGVQAFAGFTHDGAHRFVKAHHASWAAMQAHFFFYAVAVNTAAAAIGVKLGHQKQRQAFGAGGRIGQAGQHQMNDVVGQVVFATRDKNLRATDGVSALGVIRHGHSLGASQAQV